jgi:site-specific recombinase XerD
MTTAITLTKSNMLIRIEQELQRDPKLKSINTRRGYLHDLAKYEEWRAGRPLTKLLVEAYAAELQQAGKSPNTINRTLAALRWWARRVSDLALEDLSLERELRADLSDQALRVAETKDVKGVRLEKGREITEGELSALMGACARDESAAGARDAALIALAWSTGLRRSELAALQLADVKWTGDDEADITIKSGKGDKDRKEYIYNGAASALSDWLAVRGRWAGPLFVSINKSGKIQRSERTTGVKGSREAVKKPAGLSDEALAQLLEKRATQAGITSPITWHDFRRTFAGNLLENGHDLVTVQKLMGHSSPITTSKYDRRPEATQRRAVRSLHVPYQRRGK